LPDRNICFSKNFISEADQQVLLKFAYDGTVPEIDEKIITSCNKIIENVKNMQKMQVDNLNAQLENFKLMQGSGGSKIGGSTNMNMMMLYFMNMNPMISGMNPMMSGMNPMIGGMGQIPGMGQMPGGMPGALGAGTLCSPGMNPGMQPSNEAISNMMNNPMMAGMGMAGAGGPQGMGQIKPQKIEEDSNDDHQGGNPMMGMGGGQGGNQSNPMMNPMVMQNMMQMMGMGSSIMR